MENLKNQGEAKKFSFSGWISVLGEGYKKAAISWKFGHCLFLHYCYDVRYVAIINYQLFLF